MNKLQLLFAAAVLGGGACTPAPPPPDPARIETTLQLTNFSYEIRKDVGDPAAIRRAATGAVLVAFRYDVINQGQTRAPAIEIPAVHLISPAGVDIYPDPALTETFRSEVNAGVNAKRAGDINPGITMTDGVVFEVAQAAWDAGGWSFKAAGQPDALPLTPVGGAAPPA